MTKVRIDTSLYDRAKRVAELAGYSSVEEFITHLIEKALEPLEATGGDEKVLERLRGLGYIE